MNLKQLEVFVAVAENGSFSRGAEKTFLTQSTVSQHMASLENEFGLRLLDRNGKGAALTEAGKILLHHARRVLIETAEVTRSMDRFKGLEEAELRMGGSNIPGNYMIPRLLPLFRKRYPGVKVILTLGDSREIIECLQREKVEIAIVGSSTEEDGVVFTPLGCDSIVLVAGTGTPWSARREISSDELADMPFIFREQGSGTDRTVRRALAAFGVDSTKFRVHAFLGSNEAIKQAVMGGVGISFLSEMSVQKECARGEMVRLSVRGLSISRSFYLAVREGRALSPASMALVHLLGDGK